MIKLIFNSRWAKIIIVVLLVSIFLFFVKQKIKKDLPLLVETSPQNKQESVSLNTEIMLVFDRPINKDQLIIEFEPVLEYQTQEQEEKLIISPNLPFKPGQKYSLSLHYNDWQETITFTTAKIDPEIELEGIGDPRIAEEMDQYKQENYPLFEATPKRTANWTLNYLAPKRLVISYKKEVSLETVQEEVFTWIESFGLDKDSHEYVWQIK